MASCAVYNNITSASSWTPTKANNTAIKSLYVYYYTGANRFILLESQKKNEQGLKSIYLHLLQQSLSPLTKISTMNLK